MPILPSEIKWYRSQTFADGPSNGGRMSRAEIPGSVKNNIFPDVPQAERAAGSTRYRKVFVKFANPDNLLAIAPKLFVETRTPAEDAVFLFPGTFTDTQASLSGTERLYGAGILQLGANAGSTSIQVATEGAAFNLFRAGDLIRISDKQSIADPVGAEEFATVSGAPTYAGDVATISLAAALAGSYSFGAKVASCICPGDVAATVTTPLVTSSAGTLDHAGHPIVVDHVGGITQNWLLTFLEPNAYQVVGDTVGNVGAGSPVTDFAPINPDFARPYFTLPYQAFGGTFAAGDTIAFTTQPAAIALWYKRVVPAGASSFSGNQVVVGIDCESA